MSTTQVLAFFDTRFCTSGPVWDAAGCGDHWRFSLESRPRHSFHPPLMTPSALGTYDLSRPDQAAGVVAAARGAGLGGFVLDLLPWNGGYVCGAEMLEPHCGDGFSLAFQWDNGDAGGDWDRLHRACAAVVAALQPWCHALLGGRPVLIVRRPRVLPDPALVVAMLRREATAQGLPGLYLIANAAEASGALGQAGFDAFLDPDPADWVSCGSPKRDDGYAQLLARTGQSDPVTLSDQNLNCLPFTASRMVNRSRRGKVLPRVLPAFANWPDHPDGGAVVLTNTTPALYGMFLRKAIDVVQDLFPDGERAIFVESWNGWRNRSQIEPTTQAADALLRETRDAIAWGRYLVRARQIRLKEPERRLSDDVRAGITALCAQVAADLARNNGDMAPACCPACGADGAVSVETAPRWNVNGQHYGLALCRECGWRGTNPMPTPQMLERLYADSFDYGWYRAHRAGIYADAKRRLCEAAPFLGASVLDYGGGNGYLAQAARRQGLEAAVYDPYCGTPDPGILSRRWDTIFCLHVLEHAPVPSEVLDRITALLNPGGRLILAVPNAAGVGYGRLGPDWHWFQGPLLHVSHFTPAALCRLLYRRGFQLENVSFHDRWNANTLTDLERRDETLRLEREWGIDRDPALAWRNIRRRFRLLHAQGPRAQDDESLAEILVIARAPQG